MATLYVVEQGAELVCKGEKMELRRGDEVLRHVPLIKIDDVLVFGNVGISTPALKRLLDQGIEVTFLTTHGRYHGRLVGEVTAHVALRRAQYRCADDVAWTLQMAQTCVRGKLHNCRTLLRRFARNRAAVADEVLMAADNLGGSLERVERTTALTALLGLEGSATARYFRGLRALLEPAWAFEGRKRRPPTDPVNVLLSLGYTLLTHKMLGAVQAVGFDPYQGFLHRLDYNRPSLALDLVEEFRPLLVDSLVLRCCADGRVTLDDFTITEDGAYPIVLQDEGKRRFVTAFEERMRTEATHPDGADGRPGKVTYLRCLELQARRLARAVQGGAPYEPFLAR
jgi:CRISPR-associated protein Cas1